MKYSEFFDRIKEWARIHNQTIEGVVSLATDKEITKGVYQGWRKRQTLPSGEYCYKIAQYMGVSTDWLISGTERMPLLAKYADILRDLEDMDKATRDNARVMVSSLAENCRKKSGAKTVG